MRTKSGEISETEKEWVQQSRLRALYQKLEEHPRGFARTRREIMKVLAKGGTEREKKYLRHWQQDFFRGAPAAISMAQIVPVAWREAFIDSYNRASVRRKQDIIRACNNYLRHRENGTKEQAKADFKGILYEMVRTWEISKANPHWNVSNPEVPRRNKGEELETVYPDIVLESEGIKVGMEVKHRSYKKKSTTDTERLAADKLRAFEPRGQLRRYQKAVEQGRFDYFIFETNGIPSSDFLHYITTKDEFENITFVANVQLPTGRRHPVIYKEGFRKLPVNLARTIESRNPYHDRDLCWNHLRFTQPQLLERLMHDGEVQKCQRKLKSAMKKNARDQETITGLHDTIKRLVFQQCRKIDAVIVSGIQSKKPLDIVMNPTWRHKNLSYPERLLAFWREMVQSSSKKNKEQILQNVLVYG